jgi:hypothetical protein
MSDRYRRYRERRKCGIKVVSFEVAYADLREKMVDTGRMSEQEFLDEKKLQETLAALFEQFWLFL